MFTFPNICRFFSTARPLPVCKTPTGDVLEYYSSGKGRGYLADSADVDEQREELAQKYGYILPELSDRVKQLSLQKKNKLQIFHGLEPGWIINLTDKEIIKPTSPELKEFYATETML